MPLHADSEINPNDGVGGAGCIACELKCGECTGPFRVFPGNEMANNLSPHVVLPYSVAKAFVESVEAGGELLTCGEAGPVIDAEAELIADTDVPAHENPVAEGDYPVLDDDEDAAI